MYLISTINSKALSRRYLDNDGLRLLSEKSKGEGKSNIVFIEIMPN
jgi:hypothetical protein